MVQTKNGKFTAINTLDVEIYLDGVVGREMAGSGPLEALKAQAVAARSHALYCAEDSMDAPYDLVANVSQAYRGVDERYTRVLQAVKATRGEVITYKNALVPTFFHASCGGHTASIEEVWQRASQRGPRMREFPQTVYCPACAKTEHFRWVADLTNQSFTKKMKSWGSKMGDLVKVEVMGRTSSGRVSEVKLVGTLGTETMTVDKLRSLVGYDLLKSGFFEVERTSTGIVFKGEGWGHGVGLCQNGAEEMARRGATYKEILAHYFPGCQIVTYTPSDAVVAFQRSRSAELN